MSTESAAATLPPSPSGRSLRLLEREAELAALDALIARAPTGDGRMALIEGPAGIGKSRLLAEARRRAEAAGLAVLAARGGELERDFPFGIARQLFEARLVGDGAGALLAGSAGAARAVVAPPTDAAEPSGDTSFAALHGLYWLCVNLAEEAPLVLAVDDLHWCDRPSLRFLAYLVRRLEGLPILVVSSLRPAEPGTDASLIADLAHDPFTACLRPAPLSAAATEDLIAARLGTTPHRDFSDACHRATGGNPLLLDEIAATMRAESVVPDAQSAGAVVRELGARAVSRSVAVRLGRLPAEARAVADAVAVLGEGAELVRAAELAGVDEGDAAHATGLLAQAEILRPEPPIGFVHPLVRAAVYHAIAPGERGRRHARAARLLADAGASEDAVAAQLIAAPAQGEAWAVDALERAAGASLARGAADSAVAYLGRALEERPAEQRRRVELLVALGEAQLSLDGVAATDVLRTAYRESESTPLRRRAGTALVRHLLLVGSPEEAVAITRREIAAAGPEAVDECEQLEAGRLAAAFFDPAVVPLDDPEFARRRVPGGSGMGARMLAGAVAFQWSMTGGRAEECTPLALHAVGGEMLRTLEASGAPTVAGAVVLVMADRPEAEVVTGTLLAEGHRSGSLLVASSGYIFHGLTLLTHGELAEADRLLGVARDLQDVWGQRQVRMFPAAYHCEALVERGEPDRAREALEWAGMPPDSQLPDSSNARWWLGARLRLAVATGAFADAVALTDAWGGRLAGSVDNPAIIPWRSLRAEALHGLGRGAQAVAAAEAELPLARRWGGPRALGRALRVLGTVAGRPAALAEAVAVLEGSPARLELAKALAAQGTALRLARMPTEAREPLRRALELAGACGATPLAEHVRAEIYATGARPRADALSGVGALTASERRVAELAVAGQTNRDIAQSLYVTPKTVEVHLSSAYRKLGIRSRRQLPAALAA